MSEYAFVIPIIIITWTLLLSIRLAAHMDSKIDKDNPKPVVEKACPPHSWKWMEQPGMESEGVVYMWCQRCKRTPREVSESV